MIKVGNVSSYSDLTLLIKTGEIVKTELEKVIEEIESYLRKIEGPKGLKKKTSYNDYDTINGEQDTFESVGTTKLNKELELFIYSAERVWKGKIIKQTSKYIIRATPYGCFNETEYCMNTRMKDKVVEMLREYLVELKYKLKNM